ncbi:lipopolysaccharide-induced tumor necrosis factor-alpha factor homolog [Rhopalosiphum padi]|uniref:lipopolysaccharide-induced tumor necrosis factor-alpha factor homolog n=1 Tax=Rhopalosiphum padi TaxID=40932 RepID=UPI00298E4D82|nr:lipopolysaccharide-induced tumor necrosis factor-alpha factor homolog [Rhopalosiphum padi]
MSVDISEMTMSQLQIHSTIPHLLGPKSISTLCTKCDKHIRTNTSKKAKSSAKWSCLLSSICGTLIPWCMDSYNVVDHECPKCNTILGQYTP